MTAMDIAQYLDEVERRWRSRTPARTVNDVDAGSRVTRGEMRTWCRVNGIAFVEMDEEDSQVPLTRLMMRLRREFPGERWGYLNCATVDMCRRHKIVVPKTRG